MNDDPMDRRLTLRACVLHEQVEHAAYQGHTFAVLPDGSLTMVTVRACPLRSLAAAYSKSIILDAMFLRGAAIPGHLLT